MRLRLHIAEVQVTVDAARERAHGKYEPGQPSVMDAVRTVVSAYVRRNAPYPTIEHVIPVTAGGGDDDANLAIAHHDCNLSWGTNGKGVSIENRTEAFLAWGDERQHAPDQPGDEEDAHAAAESRAVERK